MRFRHVFNLSLHRNGTQSVHDLMCRSGLSAIHLPAVVGGVNHEAQIDGYEHDVDYIVETLAPALDGVIAAGDIPIPVLYAPLCKRYPNSAFLLAVRPPEDWIRSVRRLLGDHHLRVFERVLYWSYLEGDPSSLRDVTDAALHSLYREHVQAVSTYFEGQNRLLIFDLSDPVAGERIGRFLGTPELPLRNLDYFRNVPLG